MTYVFHRYHRPRPTPPPGGGGAGGCLRWGKAVIQGLVQAITPYIGSSGSGRWKNAGTGQRKSGIRAKGEVFYMVSDSVVRGVVEEVL